MNPLEKINRPTWHSRAREIGIAMTIVGLTILVLAVVLLSEIDHLRVLAPLIGYSLLVIAVWLIGAGLVYVFKIARDASR